MLTEDGILSACVSKVQLLNRLLLIIVYHILKVKRAVTLFYLIPYKFTKEFLIAKEFHLKKCMSTELSQCHVCADIHTDRQINH